jgi:cytochrome c
LREIVAAVAAALGLAALPAAGNGDQGARAFALCVACHALEPGRNTPAGPTLHDLVGRRVASLPGFNYSPALRRFAARNPRWTRALLDRFLADPEGLVPGTEMGFVGISDGARRRALIAWLAVPRRRD